MNRILAILACIGVLFTGLTALTLQRNDFNPNANTQVVDGITAIGNMSVTVLAAIVVFCGGIVLLFGVIASMGGR